MTNNEIKDKLFVDKVAVSKGVYKIYQGFFYTHGYTAEKLAEKVKSVFPEAKIIGSGEQWKDFKGGESIEKQSHWWVKFNL